MVMKIITFTCIALCLGHSFTKANVEESHNDRQDIYEIQDGGSTIKFAYPKPVHPALREIVYYHLVERPYNDSDVESVDDTRPFTNSHGLEFETTTEQAQDNKREITTKPESVPEIKQPRKLLFDLMKEKYARSSKNNEDRSIPSKDRSKRDVKWIIPNPSIPRELNLNDLPSNVRLMVSPRNLNIHNYNKKREDSSEISNQMFRNLNMDKNDILDIKPRTYGMDLKGDSGIVWNTLFTNPGLLYDNAKATPVNGSKVIPEPPVLRELDIDDLPPYVRSMMSPEKLNTPKYENKEENIENDIIDSKMRKIFRNINIQTKDEPEIKPKTYGMYLKDGSGVVWNNLFTNSGLVHEVEKTTPENERKEDTVDPEESSEVARNLKALPKDNDDERDDFLVNVEDNKEREMGIEDDETNKEIVPEPEDKEVRKESMTRKTNNRKKPNFDDFLETDEFWNWLSSWTSLAMESILEHVDNKIKEALSKDKHALDDNNEKDHKKSEKEIINSSNKNAPNKTSNRLKEKYNVSESKKDAATNLGNTNSTTIESKKETPATIEANNVYGNSVGNEKVTNIFIFYPNKDSIDSLRPKNTSDVPVNVFPNDKHTDITEKTNSSDTISDKPNQSVVIEKEIGSKEKEYSEAPHATTTSPTSESTTQLPTKDNNSSDTPNNVKILIEDKKLDTKRSKEKEHSEAPHATTTSPTSESTTQLPTKGNNSSDTLNNVKILNEDKKLDTNVKNFQEKLENTTESNTEDGKSEATAVKNSEQDQEKAIES